MVVLGLCHKWQYVLWEGGIFDGWLLGLETVVANLWGGGGSRLLSESVILVRAGR